MFVLYKQALLVCTPNFLLLAHKDLRLLLTFHFSMAPSVCCAALGFLAEIGLEEMGLFLVGVSVRSCGSGTSSGSTPAVKKSP